jgi:hypothetical protein
MLQALANIIATASSKLLPEKQLNEAALAVKNTLFAAAAAHSYRQQQVGTRADASEHQQLLRQLRCIWFHVACC